MGRYAKGIVGGFLAILAAFGWTVAIGFVIAWKGGVGIWGIEMSTSPAFLLPLFLIFVVAFYLAFRTVYGSESK